MKLVGYIRVSSESQLEGFGLDVQEKAIRTWARRNGHRLVDVRVDAGVSGATDAADRPGLSAALLDLQPPKVADGLLIPRLDRLARAVTVQEAALAIVWRGGGHVFAVDGGEIMRDDPDDPMRTAMREMVGVFAGLERRMITKRLRDGRRAKAASGRKSVGAYAYGYKGQGRGRERDAAPAPEEQQTVEVIARLRRLGKSYRQIATELDAQGIKPRRAKRWAAMTVRSVALRASAGQS